MEFKAFCCTVSLAVFLLLVRHTESQTTDGQIDVSFTTSSSNLTLLTDVESMTNVSAPEVDDMHDEETTTDEATTTDDAILEEITFGDNLEVSLIVFMNFR